MVDTLKRNPFEVMPLGQEGRSSVTKGQHSTEESENFMNIIVLFRLLLVLVWWEEIRDCVSLLKGLSSGGSLVAKTSS